MKGGLAVWLWLCTAGLASAAEGGQALEFTDQAGSPAECHGVLAELGWVCAEFDTPQWVRVYGQGFWHQGSMSVLRHDLDGDGMDDLVIKIMHPAYCDDTGCYARIMFGTPDHAPRRAFGFVSAGPIRLETRRGEPGIVYGPNARFRPTWDVKQLAGW